MEPVRGTVSIASVGSATGASHAATWLTQADSALLVSSVSLPKVI